MFGMQNIEEHSVSDRLVWQACPFGDEITLYCFDVRKPFGLAAGFRRADHLRIDVQGVDDAGGQSGGGNSESAVPAAKLDYIAAVNDKFELRKDVSSVKESLPHLFIGHATVANFHKLEFIS